MNSEASKEDARQRIANLVERFTRNERELLNPTYNETQARTEYITPFLEALGWDVHNREGLPLAFREVIEEASIEVGGERSAKRPDYELRLARQRKLFVEAKKPSVRIDRDSSPAFQTRRYGYSASLPISIVTNFHQLAIYDCFQPPLETDEARVARRTLFRCQDYEDRFDELWDALSREAVYSGSFDRQFKVETTRRGAEQFDDYFLRQVRKWRRLLADDIYANNPALTADELTYSVQLFLLRIVFLRICEDREIEKYETLKNIDRSGAFDRLMSILRRADDFYDSGLFALLDDERLGIRISDSTLKNIVQELYYPLSPYTFSVVRTEVLGEIYEQFLGEEITVDDGAVDIVMRPEVRESGGVVPTPTFIADWIVERTVGPAISGESPESLRGFTVADICCGSGIFLLSAYEFILNHYLKWYLDDGPFNHSGRRIYESAAGQWRLTFGEKRRILLEHLRGVDIDPNAVDVTVFSLLLKLTEGENEAALKEFVRTQKQAALPDLCGVVRCGNSLVSIGEWQAACGPMPIPARKKINPFTWADEFPTETNGGGFSVIIGNPPYVRIQNMVEYSPEEMRYYQQRAAPYRTAQQDNFDKYALFIERSLSLVRPDGRIGVIVPHKFMSNRGGCTLRTLLTERSILERVVYFGVKHVFGPDTSNYTCILILNCRGTDSLTFERAGPLEEWRYGRQGLLTYIKSNELGSGRWLFADEEVRRLFSRIREQFPVTLSEVAEIRVGVQTSADKIYILQESSSSEDFVNCRWNDREWGIERSILRPCLHDVPLHAYARPVPNAWMIFPYEIVGNPRGQTRARLFQPSQMRTRFPRCWQYLCARRRDLESRSIAGGPAEKRQWYQYGRSQSLTQFDRPKIVFPVLSLEQRYAYDDLNTVFTGGGNGPYYMIRALEGVGVSTLYLLAILNHPLSEAFVRTGTSVFRGGYYSHGKQFIESLPVPHPSKPIRTEVEDKVLKLLTAVDEYSASRTQRARQRKEREVTELRCDVERVVTALFQLSPADMRVIDSVPVPS